MPKKITINTFELYDESKGEFINDIKSQTITLEHSLLSISKWEAKWKVPFVDNDKLTQEQLIDYIRCMTVTQNVDPRLYNFVTNETVKEVAEYIHDGMTATTFSERPGQSKVGVRTKKVTSELIYYWMTVYNIPPEYQKWHLNRLLTLIRICDIESRPKKNMSKADILKSNRAANAARRKRTGSKG